MGKHTTLALATAFVLVACGDDTPSGNDANTGTNDMTSDAGNTTTDDLGTATDDMGSDAEADMGNAVAPGLSLQLDAERVRVRGESSAQVAFSITRRGELGGAISVAASGLPTGVAAQPVSVNVASDEGSLVLTATGDALQGGPFPVTIRAVSDDDNAIVDEAEFTLYVAGAPGTYDESFSTDGQSSFDFSDRAQAVRSLLPLPDGSLLVSGVRQGEDPWQGFTFRIGAGGELDNSYGTSGVYDGYPGVETSAGKLVRNDDKVYLRHSTSDGSSPTLFVSRLTDNGAIDPTWASGGREVMSIVDFVPDDGGFLVLLDGALQRWAEDGTTDPTFQSYDFADETIVRIDIDSMGRILAALYSPNGSPRIARLNPDGTIDTTFGAGGLAAIQTPAPVANDAMKVPRAIATDDDDNVYVFMRYRGAGNAYDNYLTVVKFAADGSRDTAFGGDGTLVVSESGIDKSMYVVDGGILVVFGVEGANFLVEAQAARFRADGSVDTAFNETGVLDLPRFPDTTAVDAEAGRFIWQEGFDTMKFTRIWL